MIATRLPYPSAARRYERRVESVFGGVRAARVFESKRQPEAPSGRGAPASTRPAPVHYSDELELQARWFAGEFGRRFSTPAGEPVEIIQFGHWNRSAGPDFTEAVVRVGERRLSGAIELDTDVRDWEYHGHGVNRAYDEVVLHLFVRLPERVTFFTRNSSHREVAQAELDLGRFEATRSVMGFVPEAKLGRCAAPLESMDPENVATLVTAAAQFRLQRKAKRFQAIEAVHGREQALWIGVAEALGYRHNTLPMAVLAQRFPIARLRCDFSNSEREALLSGAAGFIDGGTFDAGVDTRAYVRGVWDGWWKLRPDHELGPERALSWTLSGLRPLNHPQRRLAALIELAHRWPEFLQTLPEKAVDDGRWVKTVHAFLCSLSHEYWSRHYTLRSRSADKGMALVGRDRAHDIIGNVVAPIALGERRDLWEQFTALPASLDNQSLRRARLRLFGQNEALAKVHTRNFFQQQALLQIYRDFCLVDDSACASCPFPEQLAQWR